MEKGDRLYIFTATLNTFYIKLLLYREELIKRFTLFYASWITCALRILFLSMVIMFYICASINKVNNKIYGRLEVIIEIDRGRKKSGG